MKDQSPSSTETAANEANARHGGSPRTQTSAKKPLIILAVIVVILLVAAAVYYVDTRNQEVTDDAQVDGNAVSVEAKASGYVIELDVADNQQVKAGQLLFRIDPRDYIASRNQARASVAQAVGQEKNARANLEMMLAAVPKPTISVGFKTVILGAADRRDDDFRHGRGQGSVT